MITELPRKRYFKRYHSDKHLSEFLPTRWRQKSTGIDMEQSYVTVTPCIRAYEVRIYYMYAYEVCAMLKGQFAKLAVREGCFRLQQRRPL